MKERCEETNEWSCDIYDFWAARREDGKRKRQSSYTASLDAKALSSGVRLTSVSSGSISPCKSVKICCVFFPNSQRWRLKPNASRGDERTLRKKRTWGMRKKLELAKCEGAPGQNNRMRNSEQSTQHFKYKHNVYTATGKRNHMLHVWKKGSGIVWETAIQKWVMCKKWPWE